MARRNLTDDFLELDTDDFSLETTVPTDISESPDISEIQPSRNKKKLNRQLLERKQLLHDIQVLKIELSQKALLIDNLKAEHLQKSEELEEKLNSETHTKQILQARLESQIKIQQEDARQRQDQIQQELDTILRRQQELEATNERLQERAVDVRRGLEDLQLTDTQYSELAGLNQEELALKDYVRIKLYEATRPLKKANLELKVHCKQLTEDLHRAESSRERYKEDLHEEKRQHGDIQTKHQKMSFAFADIKSQVQHGDYKIENYDRVKRERDEYETELQDLRKRHVLTDGDLQNVSRERDDLLKELSALKQTSSLLQKDKDYFARQVNDVSNKLLLHEERGLQLHTQLEDAKRAREELYDKYVASRDQYKMEYEAKLRDELEQIRVRTGTEIDRLKTSTREMFERENRNLREARDMAISEKDSAQAASKEATLRYEQLLQEYRQLQLNNDNKMCDIQNEIRLKAFECERTQMVHEETVKNLKECQLENEKLSKKLEVLTKEYYGLQMSTEKRMTELESDVNEKKAKLETYERLEQELDDVVMQAAEVEDEDEAERVLFAYGYGANVPTTSKRRLKQSVHLARRVLQLERANTSLRKEAEKERTKTTQLAEELKNVNQILDQSQQPYNYLIESLRLRDQEIRKLKQQLDSMEEDVHRLTKERGSLSKAKNRLATDMERLLNQKEEMAVMKQVMLNINQRHINSGTPRSKAKSSRPTSARQPIARTKSQENIYSPAPTEFTKGEVPQWYKRLQQKAQSDRMKHSS